MKKILIVVPGFEVGGTNSSLFSILSFFGDCNIKIFPISRTGCLKEQFKRLPLLKEDLLLNLWYSNYNEFSLWRKIPGFIIKTVKKIANKYHLGLEKYILKRTAQSKKFSGYDLVIGFQEGNVTEFASYIPAKEHISWVHCNLKFSNWNFNRYIESYSNSDKIICVSQSAKDAFDNIYPKQATKSEVIYNLVNTPQIIHRSQEDVPLLNELESQTKVLLSVGRISPIKQFNLIPQIAARLKAQNIKFKWFILGDGTFSERKKISDEISGYNVEDCVFMLGYKPNPYPFFKRADIFVCTSKSEACPMVFLEANVLDTYVVTNDFPSAYELIDNNGLICSIDDMADHLIQLVKDNSYKPVKKARIIDAGYAKMNSIFN